VLLSRLFVLLPLLLMLLQLPPSLGLALPSGEGLHGGTDEEPLSGEEEEDGGEDA
jgi:hypothetical protein